MDAEKLNQSAEAKTPLQEAVYLVDRAVLLHLKEARDGSYEYAVFDRQTMKKTAEGRISEDTVMDGVDPAHDFLAAARDAAVAESGLDGIEVARVGLTSLQLFPASDIHRRLVWEPETLPKNDIRFIDSRYTEQFRIPDGGTVQIEYPDRALSVRCEYLDDTHAYIGGEVYDIGQFARAVERNGGTCRPEPVLDADRAAWMIGVKACLTVECCAGYWDYHIFDDKLTELKSGKLEVVGFSINEVRNMILAENGMGRRSMKPTDYTMLMDKVSARAEQERMQKPSIRDQLAAAKAAQVEKPAAQHQHQKDKEAR